MVDKEYSFTATSAGYDVGEDGVAVYIAEDTSGGPYFSIVRKVSTALPQPEDLYIEYGAQGAWPQGSLKRLTLTRHRVDAVIEGGVSIHIALQIGDGEWRDLQSGFDELFNGLEPFIQHH